MQPLVVLLTPCDELLENQQTKNRQVLPTLDGLCNYIYPKTYMFHTRNIVSSSGPLSQRNQCSAGCYFYTLF